MTDNNNVKIILDSVSEQAKKLLGEKLDGVVLFGSYARGDYDDESDIDIMVRVKCNKDELNNYMFILSDVASDLSLEYDVTVSVVIFDTETFYKYENAMPFLCNVKKEGVPSFNSSPLTFHNS